MRCGALNKPDGWTDGLANLLSPCYVVDNDLAELAEKNLSGLDLYHTKFSTSFPDPKLK